MLHHREDQRQFGGHYERRLPAEPSSLAEFRQSLREWVATVVDDPACEHDIVLAASELATATIRSAPSPSTDVMLRAWVDDGAVVVESGAEPKPHEGEPAAPGSFAGSDGERGFSVVAALADTFAVTSRPEGVVVRARLRRERFDGARRG